MTWDPEQYLELARKLRHEAGDHPSLTEAMLRSSTSRAYYAAFQRARVWAASQGYQPSRIDSHADLVRWLKQGNPEQKKIARWLSPALDHRKQADYDAELPASMDWETVSDNVLRYATNILQSLRGK